MLPVVPDVADLVIYFNSEATQDQIREFWEMTLSTTQEKGHWPRPGIGSILRHARVAGHEAVIVSFSPGATQAQRDDVLARVKSSRIVHKMSEHVPLDKIENLQPN